MQLQGHWVSGHTLFLDTRQMSGRVGFHVLTPLQAGRWPLAAGCSEFTCHAISSSVTGCRSRHDTPSQVVVTGTLRPAPAAPACWVLMGPGAIRQAVTPVQLAGEWRRDVVPAVLWRDNDEQAAQDGGTSVRCCSTGDSRNPSRVAKHEGYAFQWLALSVAVLLLLLWHQSDSSLDDGSGTMDSE